jgi:hypothetical protein
VAISIIGEVQGTVHYAEKSGNLVLNLASDLARFQALAECGGGNGALPLLQLGHAGALAYEPKRSRIIHPATVRTQKNG